MPFNDSDSQVNADSSLKMEETKLNKEFLQFSPRPQRVLRMNRRGFYMSGNNKPDDTSLNNVDTQKSNINNSNTNCAKSTSKEDQLAGSCSKVLKTNSSKRDSNNGIEKCLKRTLNGDQNCTSSQKQDVDEETPPKKKHKPITWP